MIMVNASYDINVSRDIMVSMRDGIRLATDIYVPAIEGVPLPGKHPAILHRTPYNKSEIEDDVGYCRWFARHGYVAVIQDCRGTFESEGEVNFLFPEAEDGVDTLKWIAAQPWSNGKVGAWGTSWSGWTQTAMAALGPQNLAAMVPCMSGANAHDNSVRQGGAMELRFLAWAFWHSAVNTAVLRSKPKVFSKLNFGAPSFADWLARMPIRKGQTQLKLVPAYEQWVFDIFTQADYTDYWKHPSLAPALYWDQFPDAPVLIIGGWYDSYTRAAFQNFQGLSRRKKGPIKIIMGPWVHGMITAENSFAGDVEFGKAAALASFRELHRQWFDYALKGMDTGVAKSAPVRIFVMGGGDGHRTGAGRLFHGGRWRDEQDWPLARTDYQAWFLHGTGLLSPDSPPDNGSGTTYRFDPSHPMPSIGGNVSSLGIPKPMPSDAPVAELIAINTRIQELLAPGGFDQVETPQFWGCKPPCRPLSSRPDILVYQSLPLETDLEITGPIEVKLWVSSSAVDTDFTAKLIDVYPSSEWYPDGYALNLTDGIRRLRYRNGSEQAHFLPPGEVAEITITLYPTSNSFVAGHRIRLDIASSNFPKFDVNPNTGEPIGLDRRKKIADNTVYHNAASPSRILLPVIPRPGNTGRRKSSG